MKQHSSDRNVISDLFGLPKTTERVETNLMINDRMILTACAHEPEIQGDVLVCSKCGRALDLDYRAAAMLRELEGQI